MFVYVLVCCESLKLYVGQHKGEDLGKYLSQKFYDANRFSGKRSHIYAAMRKHPRDSWSIWPLVSEVETRAELDELEKHFIRVLKAQHPDVGYNLCDGGEGHTGPLSEETKQKIRDHHLAMVDVFSQKSRGNKNALGCKHSADAIARTQGGKNHSPEWRRKQSIAHRGQRTALGLKRTPEQRERLSQSHVGKPWSAARRSAQEQTS